MKIIHFSGKRKTAIARATLKEGKGRVRINKIPLELYEPKICRQRIMEPLMIASEVSKKCDIDVNIIGGGQSSQADAARLAISRCLVGSDNTLENQFLDYDRHLIVADIRRKEKHKPNCQGKARSKRQKSYR